MSGRASKSCQVCGARFANAGAQSAHLAGTWGDPAFPRRCRTEAEMIAGGMWKTQRGAWHGAWSEGGPVKANAWQGRPSGTTGDAA